MRGTAAVAGFDQCARARSDDRGVFGALRGGVVVAALLHPEPDHAFKPATPAGREEREAALHPAQRVHGQRHRQHQARHEGEVSGDGRMKERTFT